MASYTKIMKILVKRVYDPASSDDGLRVFVDRLWPRGVTKEEANIDLWLKEVAPSNKLRVWFHQDSEKRFEEFSKGYKEELCRLHSSVIDQLKSQKIITFVTAVKDIEHSHIPVLISFLNEVLSE